MSKLLRVSEESFVRLNNMARRLGISKQEIIDEALEKLERVNLMQQANEAYARLRKNPEEWREEERERDLWESALGDGLEDAE
jgi:predicted DNA-binding protein